jgi:hypothetical protein
VMLFKSELGFLNSVLGKDRKFIEVNSFLQTSAK